ncbi:hypothetical protein B597_003465 [Stutzerimonas stutzeri KOS6]|uniref:CoA transferase n=1 Tax=Stutzerimonas stutzeri KOS6 TaxID=1218352 RepID=A0A061JSJ0_STUST|nr:hypothetical protein B597_003465 [Stutzerimonas stutzeri KOS6]
MLLADMGAEVLRIEREDGNGWPNPVIDRGRKTLTLDIRICASEAFIRNSTASMRVAPAPRFSRTPGKARRTLECALCADWD